MSEALVRECQEQKAVCVPIWGALFKVMYVKFLNVKNVTLNVSDVMQTVQMYMAVFKIKCK
jgi:hypothetical protein